jgi:integrase
MLERCYATHWEAKTVLNNSLYSPNTFDLEVPPLQTAFELGPLPVRNNSSFTSACHTEFLIFLYIKQLGFRSGNWLSAEQSSEVLKHAYGDSMRAKRDYAMLAMLFGCGFRRSELVGLELDEIQRRQGHWAAVDRIGKGGHIRTVPIPEWVKSAGHRHFRGLG